MRNFGYKICYKERGSKKYIRYFMTYTYPQALKILYYFISYPPDERETGRKLIIPVSGTGHIPAIAATFSNTGNFSVKTGSNT